MEIYIKQIQNGYVVNDYTNGQIWYESTIASVTDRVISINGGEKIEDQAIKFDPLPSDLPPPPEGFVYFGKNPIYVNSSKPSYDAARLIDGGWRINALGDSFGAHYAVRIGSQAHEDAIQAHITGQPV